MRVCACPGRDRKLDEASSTKNGTKETKKRSESELLAAGFRFASLLRALFNLPDGSAESPPGSTSLKKIMLPSSAEEDDKEVFQLTVSRLDQCFKAGRVFHFLFYCLVSNIIVVVIVISNQFEYIKAQPIYILSTDIGQKHRLDCKNTIVSSNILMENQFFVSHLAMLFLFYRFLCSRTAVMFDFY